MRKRTKNGLGAIGLLAIIVVAALFFSSKDQQTGEPGATLDQDSVLESASPAGEPESDADQEEVANTEDSALEGRGKRIVEAPDTRQDIETSMHDWEQEHVAAVSNAIESALAGNAEDAWTTIQYAFGCSKAFRDETRLYRAMEYYESRFGGMVLPMEQGIGLADRRFDSMEEWLDAQRRRMEECQSTEELFGVDLRTRIKLQAEKGNVVARFMYALWPPKAIGEPNDIFVWLEYTRLAHEFTMQNVSEGEPLGMFALGLSYRNLDLFTPHNMLAAVAFLRAAEICGIQGSLMEDLEMRDQLPQFPSPAGETAEALVQEFCR